METVLNDFNKKFKTKCCGAGLYRDEREFLRCSACHNVKCIGDCCVEPMEEEK